MVRDTDEGVRYLEKTKEASAPSRRRRRRAQLFGLGGVFYDGSFALSSAPPRASTTSTSTSAKNGTSRCRSSSAGSVLAGSYNQPHLFGTKLDVGVDVFGIAIRGIDSLWVDGGRQDPAT